MITGGPCSRARPECSLQVFYNLDTRRSVNWTTACGMSLNTMTPKLFLFIFNLLSLSGSQSVSTRPVGGSALAHGEAKCIHVTLLVIATFLSAQICSKCICLGVHLRVYGRTGVAEFQTFLSVCRMCARTRTFPLRTSWEHTNTCVCQLPGIQGPILCGPLLAALSHYSRCC